MLFGQPVQMEKVKDHIVSEYNKTETWFYILEMENHYGAVILGKKDNNLIILEF